MMAVIWVALFGATAWAYLRETFVVEAETHGGMVLVAGLILSIPALQLVADRKNK
nr:MAG TPA: hypothetical protein [Caudoviricetes sp.]